MTQEKKEERIKLPIAWIVFLSFTGSVIGGGVIGGIAWGKATADIENLKTENSSYKDDFKDFKSEYKQDFKDFKKEVIETISNNVR